MPIKLSTKFRNGKFVIEYEETPDVVEAKRLWMSGKSAQYIFETSKKLRDKRNKK